MCLDGLASDYIQALFKAFITSAQEHSRAASELTWAARRYPENLKSKWCIRIRFLQMIRIPVSDWIHCQFSKHINFDKMRAHKVDCQTTRSRYSAARCSFGGECDHTFLWRQTFLTHPSLCCARHVTNTIFSAIYDKKLGARVIDSHCCASSRHKKAGYTMHAVPLPNSVNRFGSLSWGQK